MEFLRLYQKAITFPFIFLFENLLYDRLISRWMLSFAYLLNSPFNIFDSKYFSSNGTLKLSCLFIICIIYQNKTMTFGQFV